MAKLKKTDSQVDGEQPVIVLEDGTEVALSDIESGYLRQSDYTRKTQALAAEKQALDVAKANQQVNDAANSNPDLSNEQVEMTKMYLDMQMNQLQTKYGDKFDEVGVLQKAQTLLNSGINPTDISFEDIHKALSFEHKTPEDLEASIREKVIAELQAQSIDTSSIISGADGDISGPANFGLSPQELQFCAKSGEDPETYAKWKNKK